MDNVTHTLIGIAAGEALAVHRKKARVPIWIASGIGNNLPDLDVLATTFVFRDKLGYLLHHRGHTHTFLATPLLALLVLLPLWLVWRKKPEIPWREIVLVLLLGTPLHLLADFWNSYGVHPFWPLANDWIYGDMVFIVEPWIWLLLLPPIFFASTSRVGKGISLALTALILGLAWYHEFVPWPAALALTFGAALFFALSYRLKNRGPRIALAGALLVLFLSSLAGMSSTLRERHQLAGAELLLQPFPANPFCWSAMRATITPEQYQAELLVITPFPEIVPPSRCPVLLSQGSTAPLDPPLAEPAPDQLSLGTFRSNRATYDSLAQNCHMNAFLRFARFPFWIEKEKTWVVGDLRFDRGPDLGFGEFEIPKENENCPGSLPPWRGRFHPSRVN
jgi:inner membrane protein